MTTGVTSPADRIASDAYPGADGTQNPDAPTEQAKRRKKTTVAKKKRRRQRAFSPITLRILAVNLLALGILVAGLLYVGEYRRNLIAAEISALETQAEMFAVALAEGATQLDNSAGQQLAADISGQMLRRLVEATQTRARLFHRRGVLIADSQALGRARQAVQVMELPPPDAEPSFIENLLDFYDRLAKKLIGHETMPPFRDIPAPQADDYPEVVTALRGVNTDEVRAYQQDSMMMSVAVPVQRYKQVLGALMLTKPSHDIDQALFDVRLDILKVFGVAIAITVLLSVYLSGTIGRPIRKLAAAADQVRRDHSRQSKIPEFPGRDDEIGDLSIALREMTEALWLRMDAIECFAADVAHEIKNPLTSLRSAVETAARVKDPEQQRKLMSIIQDDVGRLDRLISDISDASRLDAELSRAEKAPVNIGAMLSTLVDVYKATGDETSPRLHLELSRNTGLTVPGLEGRLVQVFRNLITNAITFSPPNGLIQITVSRGRRLVRIHIDDEGPGIPAGKEKAIFERFYTERAEGEKFGTHSGLGLSISKQIAEAHDGSLKAVNRLDSSGRVIGARFTVLLPAK